MSHSVLNPVTQVREAHKSAFTSPSHDYFQFMFEGADMFSAIWQPLMKSVGRWHLEVAGLGMKNGQAALKFSHDLARCWTPGDMAAANIRYWEVVSSQVAQSSQRIVATAHQVAEAPFVSEIVALPVKRGHDVIVLPEADSADDVHGGRKVA